RFASPTRTTRARPLRRRANGSRVTECPSWSSSFSSASPISRWVPRSTTSSSSRRCSIYRSTKRQWDVRCCCRFEGNDELLGQVEPEPHLHPVVERHHSITLEVHDEEPFRFFVDCRLACGVERGVRAIHHRRRRSQRCASRW